MATNVTIGARLRLLRDGRKYSRAELARRCHGRPSESMIKAIEAGDRGPGIDMVLALAEGLDVTPAALLPPARRPVWLGVATAFGLTLADGQRLQAELDRRHGAADIATSEQVVEAWLHLKGIRRRRTKRARKPPHAR